MTISPRLHEKLLSVGKLLLFAVAGFYLYRHIALLVLGGGRRGDLDILLLAGERFRSGLPVYLLSDNSEHTKPPLLNPIFALLSRAPAAWIHLASDLLLLALPFVAIRLWNRLLRQESSPFALAGALALVGPLWFSEAAYGQYNLLLLAMALLALDWTASHSLARNLGAGALFWMGMILKPTQLIFLPLFLVGPFRKDRHRTRAIGKFMLGGILTAVLTVLLYLSFRPLPALIADWTEWTRFIGQSQLKHLGRLDNFGIPGLLHRLGFAWAGSPMITLAGLSLAMIAAIRMSSPRLLINATILLSLLFSPMSWRQNYVMLLPMAFDLSGRALSSRPTAWSWTGIGWLLVLARFNGHWLAAGMLDVWGRISGPALAATAAWVSHALDLRGTDDRPRTPSSS